MSDTEQQSGPEFPTSGLATIWKLIGSVNTAPLTAGDPASTFQIETFGSLGAPSLRGFEPEPRDN